MMNYTKPKIQTKANDNVKCICENGSHANQVNDSWLVCFAGGNASEFNADNSRAGYATCSDGAFQTGNPINLCSDGSDVRSSFESTCLSGLIPVNECSCESGGNLEGHY